MFENLSDKLQRAFKNLRGQGTLNEANVDEALREIRLAMLEADVNFKVVKELIERIRAKALGQEVLTALSPAEQVVKIVRDEMVEVLGRDTAKFRFAANPPTVVLMAGLQGSGKTTTSGKLAHWLKNGGHRPLLVSVDVYRPAAREQLKIVAQAIKAHLYEGEVGEANTATMLCPTAFSNCFPPLVYASTANPVNRSIVLSSTGRRNAFFTKRARISRVYARFSSGSCGISSLKKKRS